MLNDMPLVMRAKCVALCAHESVNQKRKYGNAHYGKERYYFHPCRVAELVATVTDDDNIIAAAALHDVLEDVTSKKPGEFGDDFAPWRLRKEFGEKVLMLVVECTNVYTKDEQQQAALLNAFDSVVEVSRFSRKDHREAILAGFKIAATANRAQRKRLEAERYATISDAAKIIKRADLHDNALSMAGAEPEFVAEWMAEKALAESLIGSWEEYFKRACKSATTLA